MGSLRNPIGPLPSSIYWRRRAVALAVLALLVLLVVWAVSLAGGSGGSGDQRGDSAGGGDTGRRPNDPITPGATDSSPPITERPGGREEVDGGAGSGGTEDGSGTGGGTAGSAGGASAGGGTGAGGGSGGGGAIAGSSGSLTGGDGIPAGPATPDCSPGDVTVSLRSVENEYQPGDTPKLKLTVQNHSGSDCRVDLGRTETVVTITDSDGDRVWSSADCPPSRGSAWVLVPAGGKTAHTLEWDRERSRPECATPKGGKVPPGSYLVEVDVAGLSTEQTSFVLAED